MLEWLFGKGDEESGVVVKAEEPQPDLPQVNASVSFYTMIGSDNINVDIQTLDTEPNTIVTLAKILGSILNPKVQGNTISLARATILEAGKPELVEVFAGTLVSETLKHTPLIQKKDSDKPCVRPSDLTG